MMCTLYQTQKKMSVCYWVTLCHGPFHGIGEVISKNKMFESRQNTNWMCYIYISTNLKTKIWVKMFTY